ncbi:5-amino-6-(5-phospho-D-ribitylamino)uracil phosphatase YigB [Providencia manganoxydans]|uniref:5-amino-6-(5-phospho-D-ribitylamino)uracil phosphatase YigB n=2 Tax=Providencia TaxID=586 RepID=A0AAI9DBE8_PROST|nr:MULTISPECIES: 5-amino-6-(5-phospho-D-ribitylamino)uracil phosphatase YigB [Providencia]MDV5226364.1 5-amino-6-(5-phospho-D-ribitylamino)uracil phosphatase YigB [Providencia rettgeri]ELR5041459.1 5-amino-6-(5-phospho-D-ribitylamino)uracil phosphatase YigB [Providencia stuartii]ELR5082716.1 5-amino-6-(5-phospho-D-ribitylamino)uracil phosphatase YigB [Providencia stuartii]ELR5112552.1 5-amino-6-(5-phospho-D-ribitylamino)uracil phosphatase YigB [Providencia stuartii]MDX4947796.1 5-amino-6-(5-ph
MHFYRPLSPIQAMTFDLDDTLYDNHPVIDKTEEEVLRFVREYDLRFNHFTNDDLYTFRNIVADQEPEICHDITRWRWLSSKMMFCHYGYSREDAQKGADDIMAHFTYWRNQIDVPLETHQILTQLAEKLPLVAITNGNAEPDACGLGQYFQFVLKAGPDGRSKPYCDMYRLAAQKLELEPHAILHVGDNLLTDVEGAIRSGMQACWINSDNRTLMEEKDVRLLPHVEICRLASLLSLV